MAATMRAPVMSDLVAAMREAALEAGRLLGSHVARPVRGRAADVTSADLEADRVIRDVLGRHHPDVNILSEEGSHDRSLIRNGVWFVVDPLDGTREFLHGGPHYGVSIAALDDGVLTCGVVNYPALETMLVGVSGSGAWSEGRKIERLRTNGRLRIAISPRQADTPSVAAVRAALGIRILEIPHVTPKVGAVVFGDVDIALSVPHGANRAYIWDYAAAALVLEELGYVFVDLQRKPLAERLPFMHRGGWCAGPAAPAAAVLDAMAERDAR